MSQHYVQDFIDYAKTSEENIDDSYVMFIDKAKEDFTDIHDAKIAAEIAAHEEKMAALRNEQHAHHEALSQIMRVKLTAQRIELAINKAQSEQTTIDIDRHIIGDVNRLIHNNDLEPDDDRVYAQIFAPVYMQNFANEITNKAGYDQLLDTLEQHNTAVTQKALYTKMQDRFRAMQNEPYGEKFAARVIAGFAELQDMAENSASTLQIDVEQCYAGALGCFGITSSAAFAARMQGAMQKISAALIFDDIEKFQLDIRSSITAELIEQLKSVDFSAQRFASSKLPQQRADELSALQSDFIDAAENGGNYRRAERDMGAIAIELKNSSYVINQPI
jgi:hypothetical protein